MAAFIIILILSVVTAVSGQADLTQTIEFDSGYMISFPSDWYVESGEATSALVFSSAPDDITGFVLDPETLRLEVSLATVDDPETALVETYNAMLSRRRIRASDIASFELGGFPAASYRFEENYGGMIYDGIIYVIQFGEGEFGALVFSTPSGELDVSEALFLSIAETFLPPDGISPGNSGGNNANDGSNTSLTNTAELITPLGGFWVVSFSNQANGSCEGTADYNFSLTEAGMPTVLSGFLLVGDDGNSFAFIGMDFARTTDTNSFFGSRRFYSGYGMVNSQWVVTVTSPMMMAGEQVMSFSRDGVACSGTVTLSVSLG
jgi:hypothetical protein